MGSCVSAYRDSDSAMKGKHSWGAKARRLFHPSPAKKGFMNGEKPIDGFDSGEQKVGPPFGNGSSLPPVGVSRDFGSKEETFFDSQAWLDSDCEDDFLSVNGEFTPSGCSTPNYQSNVPGTPLIINKDQFVERESDTKSETSPTDKKKKLADLLNESFHGDQTFEEQNIGAGDNGNFEDKNMQLKSLEGTPNKSGRATPSKESKFEERKIKGARAQCCLPSLVTNLSFSEKKKQRSPIHQNGG